MGPLEFWAFFLGLGVLWLLAILLGYLFWFVMFFDALRRRAAIWIVLFVMSFFTGILPGFLALAYFFLAYKN